MDYALDIQFPGCLEDVQGPVDIGINIRSRRVIGVRNPDQSRQVKNHVDVAHGLVDTISIANVPGNNLYV